MTYCCTVINPLTHHTFCHLFPRNKEKHCSQWFNVFFPCPTECRGMSWGLFGAYKHFNPIFSQSHWQVKEMSFPQPYTDPFSTVTQEKLLPVIHKDIWTQRCETPKTLSKKTNLGCCYRHWTTEVSYSSPNLALTRTFTVSINHHAGNKEQSPSCENNRREKINKVSSGAIRKRNNEVWRNSLKSWRRQLARPKPAGIKGGANVCVVCLCVASNVYKYTPWQHL